VQFADTGAIDTIYGATEATFDGEVRSFTADAACFLEGTQILSHNGEVRVEDVKIGDLVLTSDQRLAPVRWIGRNTVSRRFADPLRVLPIRIKAGALGDNVPSRDLLVSPDHALCINDLLIQAGAAR
jgi:hypothetical protein